MGDGFKFSYMSSSTGTYFVCIEYRGEHISGSPYEVHVTEFDEDDENDQETRRCDICKEAMTDDQWFRSLLNCFDSIVHSTFRELMLAIKTEDETLFKLWLDTLDWAVIEDIIAEQRTPSETAPMFCGNMFPGNPFFIVVSSPDDSPVEIKACGDGLSRCITGEWRLSSESSGILRIAINGPSEVDISCH